MDEASDIPDEDEEIVFILEEADEVLDAELIAEAEADIAAGRVISHEAVMRWVRSWGTENELPPPKIGD